MIKFIFYKWLQIFLIFAPFILMLAVIVSSALLASASILLGLLFCFIFLPLALATVEPSWDLAIEVGSW